MNHSIKSSVSFFAGTLLVCALLLLPADSHAHSMTGFCSDNGDGTALCEGSFSDGSSAQGVKVIVSDADERTITSGKMDADGEYEFKMPEGRFAVTFDAGEGHKMQILSIDFVN